MNVAPSKNIPDGISSAKAEPLRKRTVLSHFFGENSLSTERLLRRLFHRLEKSKGTYHYQFVDFDNICSEKGHDRN